VMPLLVICSKSPCDPPMRREHALARVAADASHDVVFLERPADIRSAASGPLAFLASLAGHGRPSVPHPRILAFARRYEQIAEPFRWAFTRHDLTAVLARITPQPHNTRRLTPIRRRTSEPDHLATDPSRSQLQRQARRASLAASPLH
jgi:hypothetical protein